MIIRINFYIFRAQIAAAAKITALADTQINRYRMLGL
jgi:hypothetical protein